MIYEHDCPDCVYLGEDVRFGGEPACNVVELYIHGDTLIRRYSSEPSNNGAMPVRYAGERYAKAKLLAKERGLCP